MKDAEVAEHSSPPEIKQLVNNSNLAQEIIPPSPNHLPNGKFAPGHTASVGNIGGKISGRVRGILDTQPVAEINYHNERFQFECKTGIEAIAWRRAREAVYGYGAADNVIDRIDGPVAQKVEHGGKDGGPIVMVTADVSQILIEASKKALEGK